MDKYGELLSLIEEIIENDTNVSIEELEERTYTYYDEGDISPSQYDHVMRLIEDLD